MIHLPPSPILEPSPLHMLDQTSQRIVWSVKILQMDRGQEVLVRVLLSRGAEDLGVVVDR